MEETNHYYPFGGVFATAGNTQPYKYNGEEFDTKKGLNWCDYGARHYDAALGRFTTNDPLAEMCIRDRDKAIYDLTIYDVRLKFVLLNNRAYAGIYDTKSNRTSVSYTHLDVYKRQVQRRVTSVGVAP